MTRLPQYTALAERFGFNPDLPTAVSLDHEARLQRFECMATQLRGIVNSGNTMPNERTKQQCWRFAARAKLAFPDQSHRFQTLANLKEEWPRNWENFVDLSAHIEGVMREVREQLEGVTA